MLRTLICGCLLLLAGFTQAGSPAAAKSIADKFSAYRGQIVLVDFWASWCGPCRRSFPWMNTMQEKYGQQNFTVVAVNMDQERSAADKFLAQYPAHFTVRYDPEGDLAKDFDVSTMPTSFILDAQGQIQSAHRGFLSQKTARYEAAIARLVKNNQQLRNPQL